MLFMGLGMAFLLNAKLTIVFLITTPILAAILAWIVTKVGRCMTASRLLWTI